MLTLTEDLIILAKFITENINETIKELRKEYDVQLWPKLCHLALVRLLLFNKKRSGEIGHTAIRDVQNKIKAKQCLLTALILVKTDSGQYIPASCILESGSEINFIAESLVQHMKLKKIKRHQKFIAVWNNC